MVPRIVPNAGMNGAISIRSIRGTLSITRLQFVKCAGIAALFLSAQAALAGLEVCNDTTSTAAVAIGYKGDQGWTSEGWWNVDAGACKTLVSGDLSLSHYYWRAEAASPGWGHENYMFCTQADEFTIVGDEDCANRGYDREAFNEIEIDARTDYTVTLAAGSTKGSNSAEKAPIGSHVAAVDEGIYAEAYLNGPDNGPGTYGEPYTIEATFRGCWASAEIQECEFHADGWRYVLSELGPTDPAIIDALNVFDIGMRLSLSGDMITYSGDRADITVRDVQPASAPVPASTGTSLDMAGLMDHLQGFWNSDDGSGYGWAVDGNQLREIFDANIMELYFFELHPECAASGGRGPVLIGYPEYDPSMGPACFLIVETGQRSLAVENVLDGGITSFSYSN